MEQSHRHTALFSAVSSVISLAAGVGIWFIVGQVVQLSAWVLIPISTLSVAIIMLFMLRASEHAGHEAGIAAAESDSATRLPSQTVARQLLTREFAAAERGRSLTIVLFSLDNLPRLIATKPVEANKALLGVGAIFKRRTRGMNMSARLDAHSFISVLGGVDESGAEKFVAKVTKDLASIRAAGQPLVVRAGVCGYEPGMQSVDDMVAKAQAVLIEPMAEDEDLMIA